ncbi:MAG: hypothetical protein SGCHY_002027 [Lobulomycetales sp.]
MGKEGWHFTTPDEVPECEPEPQFNFPRIRDLYFKAEPNYVGRFTVPVLWDSMTCKIVNNESSEIIRILNKSFNSFAKTPHLDVSPEKHIKEIDDINEWVYTQINNGVYKSGFATKQGPYEENVRDVFAGLDRVEKMLSDGRQYLIKDYPTITEADIRLFTTVVRFDIVYHGHFKCNLKRLEFEYPLIMEWATRILLLNGVKETVNLEHIKKHYYMSHVQLNPTQVYPVSDGPFAKYFL